LYGGAGEEQGSLGFDDVYILSIPSFTWIRMYPANSNATGDFPHHSLSCNVVNEAQMLIHGGWFPGTEDCDSEDQWGLHNLDMGKQNEDKSPWALYDPAKTQYVVPDNVVSAVGGGPGGGATKTVPADGFMHRDLDVLLTRTASVAERTATRSVENPAGQGQGQGDDGSGSLSAGAIAGIAVGGAAGSVALAMVCFLLGRRYRHKRLQMGSGSQTTAANPHSGPPHSFSWHPQSPIPSLGAASQPQYHNQQQQRPPAELPSADNANHYEMAHPSSSSPSHSHSPYSETGSANEPKYDMLGNAWLPQVSLMQGPPGSARSPSGNSFETLSPRTEYAHGSPPWSPRDMDLGVIRGLPDEQRVSLQSAYYHHHHRQQQQQQQQQQQHLH
jgi:hypothetical protein